MKTQPTNTLPHLQESAPLIPSPLLKEAAREFLGAKASSIRKQYLAQFEYSLRDLISSFGDLPVSSVTPGMVNQALSARKRSPSTSKTMLAGMRSFFSWSRDQGYLPPTAPTAAELITIKVVTVNPLPILRPSAIEALLTSTDDLELRLAIAFWSFAGIHYGDLTRLCWEDIVPGRSICLKADPGKFDTVWVSIRPVLNAWLRPFYCSQAGSFVRRMCDSAFAASLKVWGFPAIRKCFVVPFALIHPP